MTKYNKLIEQISKDIHDGKLSPSDLNEDLVRQIFNDLGDGAKKTYGKKWETVDIKEPASLVQKFKKNLWQFSNAKTYAQLKEMNSYLLNKGRIRSYPDFLQRVRQANKKFNENYLQAEYQTAVKGSQMAEKWKGFMKNADLFPNLEYRTMSDDHVRPEHQILRGTVKPITDDFWKTYYPPNGWRCRCSVTQTAATPTAGKIDDKTVSPEFRGNVALDEEIFTKKGGFFKIMNLDHKAQVNAEYMKLNAPYDEAYKSKNGKKVMASIFADQSEIIQNVESAMVLADKQKVDIFVRPHLESGIAQRPNPEYLINGLMSDLKVNFEENNYKGIGRAFQSAKQQGCESIVLDLSKSFKDLDIDSTFRNINGSFNSKRGSNFKEVYVIYNNEAVKITREDAINKNVKNILKKLKAN